MRFLPILVTFITLSSGALAQKGKIEGKVTDGRSGKIITGVSIAVNGGKTIAATNVDGSFIITLDAGKKYTVTLSSVGYATKELADVEVIANQVTSLDIVLETTSKTENAVVVN